MSSPVASSYASGATSSAFSQSPSSASWTMGASESGFRIAASYASVHATGFVGLKVEEDHVLEPAGIEDFGDPPTYVLVQPVHAGVDERGALVVDEELIELKLGVRKLDGRADPVDPVDELIYAGHGWRSFPSLDVMAFLGF
jgi:hypothetical protein